MAGQNSRSIVLFLHVLVLININQTHSKSGDHAVEQLPALFIFGDSFLDAGNNNYINTTTLDQANFWPYGETYYTFPTGRFSDGRLISDFIAEYAKLPPIRPFLQKMKSEYDNGVNFASAGAGALSQTFQGAVIDLQEQLRYYKKVEGWLKHKLGKAEAKQVISRAVYLFSIGINDYTSLFFINSTGLKLHSKSQFVGLVMGNIRTVVKEIYKTGGRKFGFLNLPPMGCSPGFRLLKGDKDHGGCFQEVSTLVNLHNKALLKLLKQLEELEGFKYSLYDFHRNLKSRIDHPFKYGFKEGKTACCGTGRFRGVFTCGGTRPVKEFKLCKNPNDFVYWDSYHQTEMVYKQMAYQMWSGADRYNITHLRPYRLKDLFKNV